VPADSDRRTFPTRLAPMLARAGLLPARDSGWAYEFKWDGVRAISYVAGGQVRAVSRGDKDLTIEFPELAAVVAALGARSAILDGELVAFDDAGRPDFGRLQHRLNLTSSAVIARRAEEFAVTYLVFDLLGLDDELLVDHPYDDRRSRLESLSLSGDSVTVPPAFRDAQGADVLAAARRGGLEGVVAKRRDSRYRPGERSPDWVKVKLIRTQEVVIGGWTDGQGERADSFGALVVGVYEEGRLRYAGKVGSGFDTAGRRELLAALRPLAVTESPFDAGSGPVSAQGVHYVRPDLVGEVNYGEWTAAGHLRHPSWRGWRIDKNAREVVRVD
jgi:bifunctional non-homologous end joining protein LigD